MNYIVFKTDGSFLSLFDTLDKADNFFIQDTAFDTVADWVEENGYYQCNSGNHGDIDFGRVTIVILNLNFTPSDNNTYEAEQFIRLRNKAIEELAIKRNKELFSK